MKAYCTECKRVVPAIQNYNVPHEQFHYSFHYPHYPDTNDPLCPNSKKIVKDENLREEEHERHPQSHENPH